MTMREISRADAMLIWNERYGKQTPKQNDYRGRPMIKAAFNDVNSKYGWNFYPKVPGTKVADDDFENLVCACWMTNDEVVTELIESGELKAEDLIDETPVVEEIVEETPVVEEIVEETPVVEEIIEEVIEETPVVEELVEEVIEETPVVEELVEETPVVEELVEEIVEEELVEETPVVEEIVEEVIEETPVVEEIVEEVIEETPVVEEIVEEVIEETPVVEELVEETPVVEEIIEEELVEETPVVEELVEETPVVEEIVEEELVEETCDCNECNDEVVEENTCDCEDCTTEENEIELDETQPTNGKVDFFNVPQTEEFANELTEKQNDRNFVASVNIKLTDVKEASVIDFIREIFTTDDFDTEVNGNDVLVKVRYFDIKVKQTAQNLLKKCIIANTYLNKFFTKNETITDHSIYYEIAVFNEKMSSFEYTTNTTYKCNLVINEIVRFNTNAKNNIKETNEGVYAYDYLYSNIVKGINK